MMVKSKLSKPQPQDSPNHSLLADAMSTLKQVESTLIAHSLQFERILKAMLETIDLVSQDVGFLRANHHKLADTGGGDHPRRNNTPVRARKLGAPTSLYRAGRYASHCRQTVTESRQTTYNV
ncbi:hypothetical protein NDU88_005531 [Pleurodeles waltl]|uniref:Uncharacterized protein n=1 Tax=Pleurodeles waltl TaxID=8319 RepID=A0AAV7MYD5_PLEWA|nr:hypothetical protein NDU88_005531 [Pleurodeles waltl]